MKYVPASDNSHFNEAFSYGFTFALAKRDEKGDFVGLHKPVNCKDYFTDVWWTERMKKPSKTYGFSWTPGKLGLHPYYHLAIKNKDEDLRPNAAGLTALLNEFDAAQGVKHFAEVSPTDDGTVLIVGFDDYWTTKPYLISAYTSLIRMGFKYDGGGIVKFLSTDSNLLLMDQHRGAILGPRFAAMLKGKRWEQTFEECTDGDNLYPIHDYGGILNWTGFQ